LKNLCLISLLFFQLICLSQINYALHDSLLLEGYRSYKTKSYQDAISLYKQAFLLNGAHSSFDYLQAANSAAMINDADLCEKWLSQSIQYKKTEFKTIESFSENPIFQKCTQDIKAEYQDLVNLYYRSIDNLGVYNAIQDLIKRDQFTRKISNYYMGVSEKAQEKAFDEYFDAQQINDTIAMAKNKAILWPKVDKKIKSLELTVMKNVDSLNMLDLMEITSIHGWQEGAHILLWHQRGTYGDSNWIWDYFIPLINNGIEKGRVSPSFWAIFEDFKSIQEKGISLYGYHPGKVNPQEVNKNRKLIGLPKLTDTEIEYRNNNPYGGRMF